MERPQTQCDCSSSADPIDTTMAMSCLWQERNYKGDDTGNCL